MSVKTTSAVGSGQPGPALIPCSGACPPSSRRGCFFILPEISREPRGSLRQEGGCVQCFSISEAQRSPVLIGLEPGCSGQSSPDLGDSGLVAGSAPSRLWVLAQVVSSGPPFPQPQTGLRVMALWSRHEDAPKRGEPCASDGAQWTDPLDEGGQRSGPLLCTPERSPCTTPPGPRWEQSAPTGILGGVSAPASSMEPETQSKATGPFPAAGGVRSQVLSLFIQLKRKSFQAAITMKW